MRVNLGNSYYEKGDLNRARDELEEARRTLCLINVGSHNVEHILKVCVVCISSLSRSVEYIVLHTQATSGDLCNLAVTYNIIAVTLVSASCLRSSREDNSHISG